MAQAGYTPISLYYSTTSTQEPAAADLVSGELAINIADGKLFYKNSGGNVRLLSIGYGSSTVTPTNGGVQYGTGTALALTAAGSSGQILRSNGAAAPTWADLSTLGVNTISFGTTGLTPNSATAGAVTVAGTLVTANGGTGLGGATPFTANGVLYASSASALTSGSALTFDGTNLGIGFTANSRGGVVMTTTNNSGTSEQGGYQVTNGNGVGLFAGVNGASYTTGGIGSANNTVLYSIGSSDLVFGRNTTEGMRLTSTGLGIGTSSPGAKLEVYTAGTVNLRLNGSLGGGNTVDFYNYIPAVANDGFAIALGGTVRAVIDSSGNLGIGTSSPSGKLDVVGSVGTFRIETSGARAIFTRDDANYIRYGSTNGVLIFEQGSTERMRLDSSGNLGLGVTPSAWGSGRIAIDMGANAYVGGTSLSHFTNNVFFDGTNFKYKTTAATGMYQISGADHIWFSAASGFGYGTAATSLTSAQNGNSYTIVSAGTTDFTLIGAANNNVGTTFTKSGGTGTGTGTVSQSITFTQAMTLDASGNLLVGVTSGAGGDVRIQSLGTIRAQQKNDSRYRVDVGIAASNGYLNAYDDAGGVYRPMNLSASTWTFYSGSGAGTRAVDIDSSGNLLVGTTASVNDPAMRVQLNAASGDVTYFGVNRSGNDYGLIMGYDNTANDYGFVRTVQAKPLMFGTSNTERARITSGGYFKASDNGTYNNATASYYEFRQTANASGIYVTATNASYTGAVLVLDISRNTTNNTFYAIQYYNTGAGANKFLVADSGDVTNTNNSYGAISDVKTKQDIVDAASQWDDIKGLRVRKFRYKNNPTAPLQIGLVAQEAETVSPGLIDEHPDYEEVETTDEEGNVTKERQLTGTSTKSVKYSVLYMKAIKALQEAMTRIEQLEAKVSALEGTQP